MIYTVEVKNANGTVIESVEVDTNDFNVLSASCYDTVRFNDGPM